MHTRRDRSLAVVMVVVISAIVLGAGRTDPPTVNVYGDSLMVQSADYFDSFTRTVAQGSDSVSSGTAPCDWLTEMKADASAVRPSAVVLEFSGNAFTFCIAAAGYETPAYFDQYENDVTTAVNEYVKFGAHVFLVGNAPTVSQVHSGDTHWNSLNWIYKSIAADHPGSVTFVNAGASVMSSDGKFTWTLPCAPIEPHCGTDGANTVRAPDGQHFCPKIPDYPADWRTCRVYSSGSFRYGLAISESVNRFLAKGSAPVYEGPALDPDDIAPTIAPGQSDPYSAPSTFSP
jgi:hypothetical protein